MRLLGIATKREFSMNYRVNPAKIFWWDKELLVVIPKLQTLLKTAAPKSGKGESSGKSC